MYYNKGCESHAKLKAPSADVRITELVVTWLSAFGYGASNGPARRGRESISGCPVSRVTQTCSRSSSSCLALLWRGNRGSEMHIWVIRTVRTVHKYVLWLPLSNQNPITLAQELYYSTSASCREISTGFSSL